MNPSLCMRLLAVMVATLCPLAGCGNGDGASSSPPPSQSSPSPTPAPTPAPSPAPNVTQTENAKTAAQGVTADWLISNANYASRQEIEGYASATSINRGESISLFVNTVDPEYTIDVYRIGWYGSAGGRKVAGPIKRKGTRQPAAAFSADTKMVEANWTDPYVLAVPSNSADPTDWASGVYLARLTGSSGKQSYIIFTVRDDARASDILFQNSITTYAAYSNWGGYDFYDTHSIGGQPAVKISLNRPYRNPGRPSFGKGAGDFLDWELYMVRFLEREGFDVTYSTNIDTHTNGFQLQRHRAVLSVGHDEYWSREMRDAFEAARDKGVNLGFFGADTGPWQIRVEPSPISGQPNRTLVGYKYLARDADPLYKTNPTLTTYLWRELTDPPINRPEASLVGTLSTYNSVDTDMVIDNCPDWICAGTNLKKGSVLKGMLGYEVNRLDASSPANVIVLASSPYFECFDSACTKGEMKEAKTTFYTAPSGAGIFASGSMNWNWGLDAFAPHAERVNPEVQQMTRNMLRRFVG